MSEDGTEFRGVQYGTMSAGTITTTTSYNASSLIIGTIPQVPEAAGEYLDLMAGMYGYARNYAESDNELRNRLRQNLSRTPVTKHDPREREMDIWRIRQKSTGLFWNDVRWAKLEGSFNEVKVVELDEEREMVALRQGQYQGPLTTSGSSNNPTRSRLVPGYSGFPEREYHPNTREPFLEGEIWQDKGAQDIYGPGGTINVVVAGAGLLRGDFRTASGSTVSGYLDGGQWRWTSVSVVQSSSNRSPF